MITKRVKPWVLGGGFLLLTVARLASPQQSTERYIPIGESPGVSNVYSYVGRIVSTGADRSVTIEVAGGERHTLTVADDTPVWLDRSGADRPSAVGGYADCQAGRRAEILPRRNEPGTAAWIKIEAE